MREPFGPPQISAQRRHQNSFYQSLSPHSHIAVTDKQKITTPTYRADVREPSAAFCTRNKNSSRFENLCKDEGFYTH